MSKLDRFLESLDPPERPRTRRARGTRHLSPAEVALDDARRRAASGDWEGSKGATLVGLHSLCHGMTYGTRPLELDEPGHFRAAAMAANRMVQEHFRGSFPDAALFVKWTWEREKRRHAWAQQSGRERSRMSWRLQFSASMVTDFRAAGRRR